MGRFRGGRPKHAALGSGASSHLIALEPRMMFDAAAIATAGDVAETVHDQALTPDQLAIKQVYSPTTEEIGRAHV